MSWRFDMPEHINHVGYLDRSLAAIKLPIKVTAEPDGWFIVCDRTNGCCGHWISPVNARKDYAALRSRMFDEVSA